MIIKREIISIEADARELAESNTLAGNFSSMLSRCFQSLFRGETSLDEDDGECEDEGEPEPEVDE